MRTEYANVSSIEKIPLFVDSSPAWTDYSDIGNNSIKPIATDISAGMQEYIFGRNIGTNEFGIGSGMVAGLNPANVLLTGAGKSKTIKKISSKKKTPSAPSKVDMKKKKMVKKTPSATSKVDMKKKKMVKKTPSAPSKVDMKKKKMVKKTPSAPSKVDMKKKKMVKK